MLKTRNKSQGNLKGFRKAGKRIKDGKRKSLRQAPPLSPPPPDAAPPPSTGCSATSGRQGPPRAAARSPSARRLLPPAGPPASRSPATGVALWPRPACGFFFFREGPRAAGRVPSPCLAARALAGPAPALRSPGPDRKRRRTAWAWRGGRALGPGRTWARSTRSTSRTATSTRVRSGRLPAEPRRPRPPGPDPRRSPPAGRRSTRARRPRRGFVGRWEVWRPPSVGPDSAPASCSCFRIRGEAPEAGPQSRGERGH